MGISSLEASETISEVRQKCRNSLVSFVEEAWPVLEPRMAFVKGPLVEAICEHLEAVTAGLITRLLINVPPGSAKSLLVSVMWPAWEWGPKGLTSYRYISSSFAETAVVRDVRKTRMLVTSDWYQRHWPHVELTRGGELSFENTLTGTRDGVAFGSLTSRRGDRLILDDPHSVEKAESPLDRERATRRFREGAVNRLNDQAKSAIVVIMQRLHEADISGVIQEYMPDYVQLILPMEYESGRHCETEIGFSDWRRSDGELLFPARWGRQEVENLKRDMDKFAWCTPGETPILMGDLSMKRIADVEVGDEVIGIDVPGQGSVGSYRRRRLKRATVVAKDRWVRPVVRITLDSGRVIRCTADHRWYTGRMAPGRNLYAPASVGRPLLRICDPEIPRVDSVDDAREAGWLAGFFDGEGSVSLMRKWGDLHPPSSLISFYQGAGRNLQLCERLERALQRFGFDFGMMERHRVKTAVGADAAMFRHYFLKGGGLPMFQRFLHVVKPMKWRERMIQGALGTKFVIEREKVVSIEPDGEEEVFGLTTTTGNYVAWGLASQNSGQYQQRPAPRGGGIFPYNGWELWSRSIAVTYGRNKSQYPDFDMIVGSLDSAYGMKQENDYSAFIVMGVFTNHQGVQQAMLMACWQKRLALNDLVEEVIKSCRKLKVDRLLIELKGSGISVAQEIQRLTRDEEFAIQRIDPGNMDKTSRAHALSHLWGEEQADGSVRKGVVWVPAQTQSHGGIWPRDWAELCMSQMASFPKGKHDDIPDAVCQALKFFRDRGLLKKSSEVQMEEYAELMQSPLPPLPLYPI